VPHACNPGYSGGSKLEAGPERKTHVNQQNLTVKRERWAEREREGGRKGGRISRVGHHFRKIRF
jgi:hypothetical protein